MGFRAPSARENLRNLALLIENALNHISFAGDEVVQGVNTYFHQITIEQWQIFQYMSGILNQIQTNDN